MMVSSTRLSLSLFALSIVLAATQVEAGTRSQPRKKTNFTSGTEWSHALRPNQRARKKVRRGRGWFNFGWGSRRRRADFPVADIPDKPTVFAYKADALVTLGDERLKLPQAEPTGPAFASAEGETAHASMDAAPARLDDSLAQTIFDILKAGDAAIRLSAAQNKAIIAFYAGRGFKPVWTSMEGVSARAKPVVRLLERAGEEGLDAAAYALPVVAAEDGDLNPIDYDLAKIARFDVELTARALAYASDASGGRIVPNRLSPYHDLKPPRVDFAVALERLAGDAKPARYLASLHPDNFLYRAYRQELAKLSPARNEPRLEDIPLGGIIRPGDSDARLKLIREHLVKRGFLVAADKKRQAAVGARPIKVADASDTPQFAESPANDAGPVRMSNTDTDAGYDITVYDEAMVTAVKAFQKKKGLTPDGLIGPATLRALNGAKSVDRRAAVLLNMERLRWLPHDFGKTFLIANQAAFQLRAFRDGRQVWQTRIIVGKPKNQTSFFVDEMETVVFNPYWGVPQSILSKEMLPRLQNNPSYLDARGFEVYDRRGRKVSSSSVDWWNYGRKVPFSVRQPPGRGNALGKIKFLFPNKHAIYMHDTPSKSLFSRRVRAYSHGCVRVQNPKKLAEFVLRWDQGAIESKIAAGKNSRVQLKRKIPVYLTYMTAWPNDAGKLAYLSDIYGRDQRLAKAFAIAGIKLR